MSSVRNLGAMLVALMLAPGLVSAQGGRGGEPPKNLQVLPKDMSRPQVVALMRTIALSLGVRCEFCHVQTQNADGREVTDFAADDKDTKKTARGMLKMVRQINETILPGIGLQLAERHQVSCETCHHGLNKPQTLQAAMADAVDAGGADSAVALYRALRSRYYGAGAYDFGEMGLTESARVVAQSAAQRPAAIALLRLNLEFHPQSALTYVALAQTTLATGDTAAAIDAATKGAALQPDNPQLQGILSRLKRPPSDPGRGPGAAQRAPAPARTPAARGN